MILEDDAPNVLELNNGTKQSGKVTKGKFKLPFVIPEQNKAKIIKRTEHGLSLERVLRKRQTGSSSEDVKDLEEEAETVSLQFKGQVVISSHVEVPPLPRPQPEVAVRVPQPTLKRRHPFFGLDTPPARIKVKETGSKKRKRTSM